jgi:hypothetical protein
MKTLIVSWHGLGDNILITPALKAYKKENKDEELYLAHLARLPVHDLLAKCPYIKGFHTVSDVWNDYANVELGREEVMNEALGYANQFGYEKVIELTLSPGLGILHKIHRAAHELGVTVTDYQTKIYPRSTKKIKAQADKFLEGVHRPLTFIHSKAGNPPKDLPEDIVLQMLGGYAPSSVIEYGSDTIPALKLPLGNIPLEMEILSRCDKVLCADSFIMHAAGALGIPTTAVFLVTPPEWVIPLHDTPLDLFIKV